MFSRQPWTYRPSSPIPTSDTIEMLQAPITSPSQSSPRRPRIAQHVNVYLLHPLSVYPLSCQPTSTYLADKTSLIHPTLVCLAIIHTPARLHPGSTFPTSPPSTATLPAHSRPCLPQLFHSSTTPIDATPYLQPQHISSGGTSDDFRQQSAPSAPTKSTQLL
jgi:hypothetical protein